jgi:hypothetical protein
MPSSELASMRAPVTPCRSWTPCRVTPCRSWTPCRVTPCRSWTPCRVTPCRPLGRRARMPRLWTPCRSWMPRRELRQPVPPPPFPVCPFRPAGTGAGGLHVGFSLAPRPGAGRQGGTGNLAAAGRAGFAARRPAAVPRSGTSLPVPSVFGIAVPPDLYYNDCCITAAPTGGRCAMRRSLFPVVCVRLPPDLLAAVDDAAAAVWGYPPRPRGARTAFIERAIRELVERVDCRPPRRPG